MGIKPLQVSGESSPEDNYQIGVWNNFDFTLSAEDWSKAAQQFGGENAIVDLVVAQAQRDGVALPFPFEGGGYLYGYNYTVKVEQYLQQFESDGLQVILSIQPLEANITELIDILLSRYGGYSNIIGINVDMEWKESGSPYHATNSERDAWLNKIKSYNPSYKLFLTNFQDYTYFPQDVADLVILYDGEGATQHTLLQEYKQLAEHFSSVGLYTGYSSATPQAASVERILDSVPKTQYILHTYDIFENKQIVMFECDDVQVDWLEQISENIINLHIEKGVPVMCGVIPLDFNNDSVSGGYLADYLTYVNENYYDIIEIGQHGNTHDDNETLRGRSYDEQMAIIEEGKNILESIGIKPATFTPPYGDADNTTVSVLETLESRILIDLFQNLTSEKLMIISGGPNDTHWTYLVQNRTLKSADNLMAEIDQQNDGKPFMILYHIQDLRNQTLFNQFSRVLDELKQSEKYNFMTPKQYREYLLNEYIKTSIGTPSKPLLIFEMDDVQVDWLDQATTRLVDLHRTKSVPLVVGVIPYNFNVPIVGEQSAMINYLKDMNENYFDIIEIAQHGYTHNRTEVLTNQTYEEQKGIIQRGYNILSSIGIKPVTFLAPYGSADNTTVKVLEDLRFKVLSTNNHTLFSYRLLIAPSSISLTERVGNSTTIKTAETLMSEIDSSRAEAIIILYQVSDFRSNDFTSSWPNQTKINALSKILDTLKANNYTCLTLSQYRETLGYVNYEPPALTLIDQLILYLTISNLLYYLIIPVAIVITGVTYLSIKKKRVLAKHT